MSEDEVLQATYQALVDLSEAVRYGESDRLRELCVTLPEEVVRTALGATAMQAFGGLTNA